MKISSMIKTILLALGILVSLAAAQIVFGQTSEGVITYEVKINVHRTLPKDRQEMKGMIPEFRTSMQQLFFNPTESLYKPVEEDDDETMEDHHGGPPRMRFQQPQAEIYFNPASSRRISQQEFMGKEYLIEDSLKLPSWKFGTETKTVMGYECRQASYFNEERKQQVVAWYTLQLRGFLGPEIFNTLPGAVLEVNLNDGERVMTAKSMERRSLKKNEIKIPKDGIHTTSSEFHKIVDQHMERMRANGADVMIRN
jgi:GLPGLI family protein